MSPRLPDLTTGHGRMCLGEWPDPAHHVIFFVAHLGSVPAHAVHCQQQVQESKGGVQPQQVIPVTRETTKVNARFLLQVCTSLVRP